jgi:fluoride exporter
MLAAFAIGIGGALGALARYGADRLIEHHLAGTFPWSTFLINVSGCFLAGLVVTAIVDRHHEPSWVGLGLVTGFLGAYTTYSTFAQETYHLGTSHLAAAVLNVVLSVSIGIAAVGIGGVTGRGL